MNKLKKSPPHSAISALGQHSAQVASSIASSSASVESRTMLYARALVPATGRTKATRPVNAASTISAAVRPMTTAEQYWAMRALTAEAHLSTRVVHQTELVELSQREEERRAREVDALRRSHEETYARMELLVLILLGCLVSFAFATVYMISPSQHSQSTRWPTPHFTIPILSPFTSVVEHETSAVNAKMTSAFIVALACLAYGCFRYWVLHMRR
ncbi:uncharacterized protein LAESUDRAFT_727547 [Laetiporus sulphureus 93-53]|uniref:Transmembrane protein n=1 Tax=Laetiporus sulphureus 93-53 TaxID=1314785 RepID=A0A165DIS4_9APHY|nr:uncharacterized protein LAESUDRAFT_727547 [Laetiporus sulphureus 93-53]KZT04974.1 hypothetical protein LAESUDRAFT_727547 [Laetiporus sulphureus 93-53]